MPAPEPTFAAMLTTAPSPDDGHVVEVAAVSGEGTAVHALANPGRLSAAFEAFSGLHDADVKGRPRPAAALREFLRACPGPLVVADAERFRSFFEAERVKPPVCIEAAALARICCPEADDYALDSMAARLGVPAEASVRAPERARLLSAVWRALLERASQLPGPALDVVCRLAESALDPLAPYFAAAAERSGFTLAADAEAELARLFKSHRELLSQARERERKEPGEEPLPTERIGAMFSPGAVVARGLGGYEYRHEQVEMAEAVCEALNEPHHLMVEAGTGTGKSLAYLLPVIAWACTNGETVVVSTNTRNLQAQLFEKDLPFLAKLLPGRFQAALLKGRRNYLCVRRFLHLMGHFQRELVEREELMALASLVSWAARTETGDLSECNGFQLSPAAPAVVALVASDADECAGGGCRNRGHCFVQRARALAQLADVVVVNHALLFAEIGTPVLPPYRCVVFDEAQNLEDVATDAFAVNVSALTFYRVTNSLYRRRADASGSGLLAVAMHEAESASAVQRKAVTQSAGEAMNAIEDVIQAARQLFEVAAEPFQAQPPQAERVLLAECEPALNRGSEAWGAAEGLNNSIAALGKRVGALAEQMDELAARSEAAEDLARDLRTAMDRLREAAEAVRFVLLQEEESFVYWLERTTRERGTFYSLHAAPLQIGEYMRGSFFGEKRCVILTSATMQVDGAFDYMLERVGADQLPPGRIRCVAVGSPFNYDEQALVGVTTFLPDPGGQRSPDYDARLAEFLVELLQATRGRALVLFTAYSLLESCYSAVKEPLERAGIMVLAQGHAGSREAMTALFTAVPSSVLFGTRSFWEGVDIPGETLSCLVLTKLPFQVFTDPLVRGRTGYVELLGRDPFQHYTLPEAVVAFRQGFGRLIRRRTDRGVVIVTDHRMVTKPYGEVFLRSLPTRHRIFRTAGEALEAVTEFLGRPQAP